MSDSESGSASGSGNESDAPDSPQQVATTTDGATGADGGAAKRSAPNHPTYLNMVIDAVQSQQVRATGVSRAKIVQFIKGKYKLEDVNNMALKKAIQKAIEKEMLESKTGTGMNGTFVLSKAEKQKIVKEGKKKLKADEKAAAKQAETKEKKETKGKDKEKKEKESGGAKTKPSKPPAAKKTTGGKAASKDDLDLLAEKKKVTKKPPVPAPKAGKENAVQVMKGGKGTRKPKVLQEKVRQLTKSQSASAVLEEDPQPSTSKQRATKTKGGK